jgi:arginase family enzyme
MSALSVIGVPSSAGSYAAGQDQAPTVLRSAGLIDALIAAGLEVHDEGDLPLQVQPGSIQRAGAECRPGDGIDPWVDRAPQSAVGAASIAGIIGGTLG